MDGEGGERPVPPSRMRVAEALGKWFPEPTVAPKPKKVILPTKPAAEVNSAWVFGPKIRDHDLHHDREMED